MQIWIARLQDSKTGIRASLGTTAVLGIGRAKEIQLRYIICIWRARQEKSKKLI